MKLKMVVLEKPLPRNKVSNAQRWEETYPSARYTDDKFDLSYDPASQLVTISSKQVDDVKCVHAVNVWFMEPDVIAARPAVPMTLAEPAQLNEAPKRRGMPKGGWPKKAAPEVPGAIEPHKEP